MMNKILQIIIISSIAVFSAYLLTIYFYNKQELPNRVVNETSGERPSSLHTYEMLDLKNNYYATTTGVYFLGRDNKGNSELKRIDFDDPLKVISGEVVFENAEAGFFRLGDVFYLGQFLFDPKEFGLISTSTFALDLSQYGTVYFSYGGKHFKMLTNGSGEVQLLEPKDQVHVIDKNLDKHIALNTRYVVIGDSVYVNDNRTFKLLPLADAKTFEIVGVCASVEKSADFYTKDSQRVYIDDKVISENAKSFVLFPQYVDRGEIPASGSFSKDINHVFYGCGEIIEGADPKTFKYIGNGVARDSVHEYRGSFGYGKLEKIPLSAR